MSITRRDLLKLVPATVISLASLPQVTSALAQSDANDAEMETTGTPAEVSATQTAPTVFVASEITHFNQIPDFGNSPPFTRIPDYDISARWGHRGRNDGSEFIVTRTGCCNNYAASKRSDHFYDDFKAEVSFKFISTPKDAHQYAGIHFGVNPDNHVIQGMFMVRPLGPSPSGPIGNGPDASRLVGKGDIFLMYQTNSGGTWSGYHHLLVNQFGRMSYPNGGLNGVHHLQLVRRGGELLPFYNGELLKENWSGGVDRGDPYPIKDPVGRGQVGVVSGGQPGDPSEVAFFNFRVVGNVV